MKNNLMLVLLFVIILFLIPTQQAHAYLDPGSGSLIIQVLIAGLLTLAFTARMFKDAILSFLGFKRPPTDEEDADNAENDNR